jgi:hypothetical protein
LAPICRECPLGHLARMIVIQHGFRKPRNE